MKEKLSPHFESSEAKEKPKKENKPKRTEGEARMLRERLHLAAKVISNNFGLKFVPDIPPPGEAPNWRAGLSEKFAEERAKHPEKSLEDFDDELLKPELISYPEQELLDKSEEYTFGVLRHELGHIKHTDYRSMMEAQDKAQKEGYGPQDVFYIWNAWEDNRSNLCEAKDSKAARYYLGVYLKEDKENALLADLENRPLPIQYGLICWARGAEAFIPDFSFEELKAKISDPRVLEAYEKSQEALDEYLGEEKGAVAFREFFWKKGWPVFKDLIKKYSEEEAQKQTQAAGKKWGEMTEEEKQAAIAEILKDLRKQEKETAEIMAPKTIKIKEGEDGKMEIEIPAPSEQTIVHAKESEAKEADEEKKRKIAIEVERRKEMDQARKQLEELRQRNTGLNKSERGGYNYYFNPVKKYIDLLSEKLDEVFPPKTEGEWSGGKTRGKRLSQRELAREIPAKTGKMFEQKDVPEVMEAAFSLLIDVSGSMGNYGGEKIVNAIKAAVLMAEALAKKGVPFSISAFNRNFYELKRFDEEYAGRKKMDLVGLIWSVSSAGSDGNDDGYAVDRTARSLAKWLQLHDASGALIVFSDGLPNPSEEHRGPEWELEKIVQIWSKKLPLIGIGIGSDMEETIKKYYKQDGLAVSDVDKLPRALLKILQRQIEKFERR